MIVVKQSVADKFRQARKEEENKIPKPCCIIILILFIFLTLLSVTILIFGSIFPTSKQYEVFIKLCFIFLGLLSAISFCGGLIGFIFHFKLLLSLHFSASVSSISFFVFLIIYTFYHARFELTDLIFDENSIDKELANVAFSSYRMSNVKFPRELSDYSKKAITGSNIYTAGSILLTLLIIGVIVNCFLFIFILELKELHKGLTRVPVFMLTLLTVFLIIHVAFVPIFSIMRDWTFSVAPTICLVLFIVAAVVCAIEATMGCVFPLWRTTRYFFLSKYAVIVMVTDGVFIALAFIYFFGILVNSFKSANYRDTEHTMYFFFSYYTRNLCPNVNGSETGRALALAAAGPSSFSSPTPSTLLSLLPSVVHISFFSHTRSLSPLPVDTQILTSADFAARAANAEGCENTIDINYVDVLAKLYFNRDLFLASLFAGFVAIFSVLILFFAASHFRWYGNLKKRYDGFHRYIKQGLMYRIHRPEDQDWEDYLNTTAGKDGHYTDEELGLMKEYFFEPGEEKKADNLAAVGFNLADARPPVASNGGGSSSSSSNGAQSSSQGQLLKSTDPPQAGDEEDEYEEVEEDGENTVAAAPIQPPTFDTNFSDF